MISRLQPCVQVHAIVCGAGKCLEMFQILFILMAGAVGGRCNAACVCKHRAFAKGPATLYFYVPFIKQSYN
jgi:hypothetical protein